MLHSKSWSVIWLFETIDMASYFCYQVDSLNSISIRLHSKPWCVEKPLISNILTPCQTWHLSKCTEKKYESTNETQFHDQEHVACSPFIPRKSSLVFILFTGNYLNWSEFSKTTYNFLTFASLSCSVIVFYSISQIECYAFFLSMCHSI